MDVETRPRGSARVRSFEISASPDVAEAFPTGGASFSFATSLFTHLRAAHAEHSLRELG